MKKSRFTDEQMVAMVQETEATSVAEVARKHQVTKQTIYTWKRRFGGLDKSQVADFKRLEQENARLKKLLAERDLEIEVMKEINAKNGERVGADYGSPARDRPRNFSAQSLHPPAGLALHAGLCPSDAGTSTAPDRGGASDHRKPSLLGLRDDTRSPGR